MEQKGGGMEGNSGIEESQEERQSHDQRADLWPFSSFSRCSCIECNENWYIMRLYKSQFKVKAKVIHGNLKLVCDPLCL